MGKKGGCCRHFTVATTVVFEQIQRLSEEAGSDSLKDIVMFDSSDGYKTSIPDYLERNKEKLENKVLYCSDKEGQAAYVSMCKEQGLEVLFVHALIDTHFLQFLESKDANTKYISVDSELSDVLVDDTKKSTVVDKDNKTVDDRLVDIFKTALDDDKLKIESKSLKSESVSGMVIESEQIKRMKQMSQFMQQDGAPAFEDLTLIVNSNNALVKDILTLNDGLSKESLVTSLCQHVFDLAKMSKSPLAGEQMQAFVTRSNELMNQLSQHHLEKGSKKSKPSSKK